MQNFNMISTQAHVEFNRISTHQSPEGKLYFGSVEGLFVFHPDDFVKQAQLGEQVQVQVSRVSHFDTKKDTLMHQYRDLATTKNFHVYPNYKYISFDVFIPIFREAKNILIPGCWKAMIPDGQNLRLPITSVMRISLLVNIHFMFKGAFIQIIIKNLKGSFK